MGDMENNMNGLYAKFSEPVAVDVVTGGSDIMQDVTKGLTHDLVWNFRREFSWTIIDNLYFARRGELL